MIVFVVSILLSFIVYFIFMKLYVKNKIIAAQEELALKLNNKVKELEISERNLITNHNKLMDDLGKTKAIYEIQKEINRDLEKKLSDINEIIALSVKH